MDYIPVNDPVLDGNEAKYLMECIETGWISSEGPFVSRFESMLASKIGRAYGVSVSSGTAALDVAFAALNLKPGSEVVLPSFTIISCAMAIVRMGLIPVVVDCDPVTWNIDVNQLEDRISQNTSAILVVHIYGLPVDMEPILSLAQKHNLAVVEDAAEAIGQTYRGKSCGSFGDISIFSFYANKHITTGEGGMIFCDDSELAERCRKLRNLCFEKEKRFFHNELGWNYRMTNIQAAIGVAQTERLDETLAKKRWIGQTYTEILSENDKLQIPISETPYARNLYWVYGLVLKKEVPFDAEEMITKLNEKLIGCRPFFWPLHQQPALKRLGLFPSYRLPVSESISVRGFYIPSGLALTTTHIQRVADSINSILRC